MSAASDFVKRLGAQIAAEFGDDVTYKKSQQLLEWSTSGGGYYVQLAGSNKWSPYISVAFYFGRSFDEASAIERRVEKSRSQGQIHQYSVNVKHMKGLVTARKSTWEIDIGNPPRGIAKDIADSIREIAMPFWMRYPTARAARDALAARDPWCFWAVGPMFSGLLYLDAALGDLKHFEEWMEGQEPFYRRQQNDKLQRVRAALNNAI